MRGVRHDDFARLYKHDTQDFQNGSDDRRGARESAFRALLQGWRFRGRCESSPAVAEGRGVARSGQRVDNLTAGRGVPAGEAAAGRLRAVHRAATQLYPPSRCFISAA